MKFGVVSSAVVRSRVVRAVVACACVLVSAASAQIIKAPRYTGGVDAPAPVITLPPAPPAITPHATVVEDIVVRINDQIISRSDVERQVEQLQQAATQGQLRPEDIANEQKNMLRDMIDQQLLLSRAKELGLNADAALIRRLEEIRKQNKLESADDLEKAARAQGVDFADFKAQQKNQILTQMVVQDEVGRKLQMTQGEEKKYYDAHLADYQQPEQVHLSEILIPTTETATAAEVAQAETKARSVLAQARSGTDFAELAKKNSGGTSAATGGDLGLFKPGVLPKVFEDATFKLKAGELTEPIRSRQGWVILKVTGHTAAGPAAMKDVEQQIEEGMYMQQMQPALRAYLTKLRTNAYVDIQPGFIDSGGIPSESRGILNTAYAPPPVKKKAVKTKGGFRNGQPVASRQKVVVASPDTTGTRTITGADAVASAPVVAAAPVSASTSGVDPGTGLARLSAARSGGKAPRMARREKIRFGQAPRNSLSNGDDSADSTLAVAAPAPGAVLASNGVTAPTPESANLDDNPLTATAPEHGKTRFAAKQAEVKEKKVETVSAKQAEKIAARPDQATPEEKLAAQVQAAPLGLAGDTTKKQKKPKKVKGAPKERLGDKPTTSPSAAHPAAPAIDQTANPALAPTSSTPGSSTPPPAATPPAAGGSTPPPQL